MRIRFLVLATLVCALTAPSWAEPIVGRVVGVHDGDTITLLTAEKKQIKVRLYGIDAPETKQSFGARSKETLSDLVFGKNARLETVSTDRYGRTVAWVNVGGLNANQEQIRLGMAWWYQAYAKHETTLRELEAEAREAKRGLWSEPNPVPPWKWRNPGRTRNKVSRSRLTLTISLDLNAVANGPEVETCTTPKRPTAQRA